MAASERIPLIEESDSSSGPLRTCYRRFFPNGYWSEFWNTVKLSTPIILAQLTNFMVGPVALMFCGRLGKAELDGVAMANSMINVTGISIATGLATACDTLFSQIYGSRYKMNMGIALQRSLIVITLFVFPCWAIHLNMENLLLVLGQDAEVARLTGQYMLIFLPGIPAYFIYICLMKYLMNQNIIFPNIIVGLIANVINVVLHYVFVVVLSYGIQGSAVAQLITYVSFTILTILYIVISKVYEDTWSGWNLECLMEWGMFFKLAGFGMALVCVEWWSFEIGIFLSGVIGTTQLGAQSVIFQLESLAYMFPLGVGIAASIRVGQFLGARRKDAAVTAASVAISSIGVVGLVVGALLFVLKDYLPRIFTNVEEVVSLASTLLPILGIYMVFDSIGGVCNGILRGSGRQNLGAGIVSIAYVIALSIGIPLMFLTNLGTAGYWWGLAIGIFFESVVFTTIILRTDWNGQVAMARARTSRRNVVSRLSVSLSVTGDVYANMQGTDQEDIFVMSCSTLPKGVILRTVFVILAMVGILVLGILCRLFIPVNTDLVDISNSTADYNGTLPLYTTTLLY